MERIKEYKKEWQIENKRSIKGVFLMRHYGVTLEEYDRMFEEQNGCCAICGRHQSEFKKSLEVDHNHKTKKIRELLCGNCNRMLGQAMENIDTLQKGINYLEKWMEE